MFSSVHNDDGIEIDKNGLKNVRNARIEFYTQTIRRISIVFYYCVIRRGKKRTYNARGTHAIIVLRSERIARH